MVGENPYQAPLEVAELVADDQDRNQALARVRFAVIALAVPGLESGITQRQPVVRDHNKAQTNQDHGVWEPLRSTLKHHILSI